MPGITPWWASSRRQMRQSPNFLKTARGRPHRLQREYARTLYRWRAGGLGDHRLLGHYSESLLSSANGSPRPRSSARAPSSSVADVVMAMSRPRTAATSS